MNWICSGLIDFSVISGKKKNCTVAVLCPQMKLYYVTSFYQGKWNWKFNISQMNPHKINFVAPVFEKVKTHFNMNKSG